MTDERPSDPLSTLPEDSGGLGPESRPQLSLAERYGLSQKAAGIAAPILTALLAFVIGGVVIVITTGKSPLSVYQAIFEGSGLNWFFEVGSYEIGLPFSDASVWFPWNVNDIESVAAVNLQQTMITWTTLVLTGLAVAFAFRCGMFNIGGQGQYIVGGILAVWIGSEFSGMDPLLHVLFAVVAGSLCGAAWAGIAGLLKATVGAHEVITTIMLNWIAIWVGFFLFGLGGPLQSETQTSVPISNDVAEGAKLPVFWGDPLLQGLHIGVFVALGALVVYWMVLNRTTLGYGVKAVGFNPEAARYGGISVARNYFLAMAISGAFAGLAGAIDILGWQSRLSTSDIQTSTFGFVGIAVALLGRNSAVGVAFAALLFAALVNGTSTRNLDPETFQPELASNLTWLIQGLVVLFVGADIIVLTVLYQLGRLREATGVTTIAERMPQTVAMRHVAWVGIGVGALAAFVALPPIEARSPYPSVVLGLVAVTLGAGAIIRGERRMGGFAVAAGIVGATIGYLATRSSVGHLEAVVVWSALLGAMLRWATPLTFAALGGLFSERSGVVNIALEGMMLMGAFFAILGADKLDSWWLGLLCGVLAGGVAALVHAFFSIHLRADQIVGGTAINLLALGVTGYLFIDIYGEEGTPTDIPAIPDVHLSFIEDVPLFGDIFGQLNLMIWIAIALVVLTWVVVFKTPAGLRIRSVGEHPRAADTVGINVYAVRYAAVILSGMLAAAGGAYLSIGFVHSFSENMTAGKGFIALAAVIFGNWRPFGAAAACLLFGFSTALAQRLPEYSESASVLFSALPYVLTLIAVAGVIGRSIPPAASGRPYKKQ